jgi:hypothetical protein
MNGLISLCDKFEAVGFLIKTTGQFSVAGQAYIQAQSSLQKVE